MPSESAGSTTIYDILGWLESNKQKVIITVVVLILAGLAIAVAGRNAENKAIEADAALLKLRTFERVADGRPAADANDFLKVATDYANTPAADRAKLLAARANFDQGEYAKAKAEYEGFLKEHANYPLADFAAFGVAACIEAGGDLSGALSAYQTAMASYKQSPYEGQAKLAIARIYEAQKKPDLALRTYDELSQSASAMMLLSEVLNRKERLLGEHPELAATNAASALPTTNPVAVSAPPSTAPRESNAPAATPTKP